MVEHLAIKTRRLCGFHLHVAMLSSLGFQSGQVSCTLCGYLKEAYGNR